MYVYVCVVSVSADCVVFHGKEKMHVFDGWCCQISRRATSFAMFVATVFMVSSAAALGEPNLMNRTAGCMLTCIDVDGPGRRLEASFSCVASAHELGLRYVHAPLFELQHADSKSVTCVTCPSTQGAAFAEETNEWFGVQRAFADRPPVRMRRASKGSSGLYIGPYLKNLVADEEANSQLAYRLYPGATKNDHTLTSHTGTHLCSGITGRDGNLATKPALRKERSWLHALEAGDATCERDGRSVAVRLDCTAFFWCTIVAQRRAASWYAMVPRLQSAYAAAVASAARDSTGTAVRTWSMSAARRRVIRVGIHVRTVKRRLPSCLSGAANLALIAALKRWHRRHTDLAGGGDGPSIEFIVHTDLVVNKSFILTEPPRCPSHTCDIAKFFRNLWNTSGVSIRYQSAHARDALVEIHSLIASDILLVADSSFSFVSALLSNGTVFAPTCGSRTLLPHWIGVPCAHGVPRTVLNPSIAPAASLLKIRVESLVSTGKAGKDTAKLHQRMDQLLQERLPWPLPPRSPYLMGRRSALLEAVTPNTGGKHALGGRRSRPRRVGRALASDTTDATSVGVWRSPYYEITGQVATGPDVLWRSAKAAVGGASRGALDLTSIDSAHRRIVADAVLAVSCCKGTGCRGGSPRVRWWKGAFGSQLNTMLTIAIHSLVNGSSVQATRMSIVPFEQDRQRPQPYVDAHRCRTAPSGAAKCLFRPVAAACEASGRKSTASEQAAAGKLLQSTAHPYLLASEAARIMLSPNAWLAERVKLLTRALGDACANATAPSGEFAPGVAVHVRRGDKLTATGSEVINLPPTSAIARRIRGLADAHGLRTVLVMSDDAHVPHDLAAVLPPSFKVVGLEIPRMENATLASGRHRATAVKSAVAADRTRTDTAHQQARNAKGACGLPAYAGRPALPRCATGAAGEPQATIIDLPAMLASHGAATTPNDLGALLHAAAWVMASARVVFASSASNVGALLFALAGSRSIEAWDVPPILVDNEEREKLRLSMRDLANGLYYCRQDWGMRRFGLCKAGQQGRPLKTW